MDAGRKVWTLPDGILREIVWWRPPKSTDFRLPLVRNQQVTSSSLVAGSSFSVEKQAISLVRGDGSESVTANLTATGKR
jgi:hypothetical protein